MKAVIPVKCLDDAKERLSGLLTAAERRALMRAMVEDVLAELAAVTAESVLDGIIVVSPDDGVADIAERYGAQMIVEQGGPDLSSAVSAAAKLLLRENIEGMIVVPGDVPLITSKEITRLITAHRETVADSPTNSAMTISPASDDGGTNALLCSPPDAVPPSFGQDSCAAHLSAAQHRNISVQTINLPGVGLDIDVVDDIQTLMAQGAQCRTADLLNQWDIAGRIACRDQVGTVLDGLADQRPDTGTTARLVALTDGENSLDQLIARAGKLRDQGHGQVISYSRKLFIPLTHLCRDVCHYCTFSQPPIKGEAVFMTRDQVLAAARAGAAAGCNEALFTLGDKPEVRFRAAREALADMGYGSTIEYLVAMADAVFEETGLLPHLNPGVMTAAELAACRNVSVSQGIMLETISDRLSQKGGPHYGSPDKDPAVRLAMLRRAGEAKIPFTTGILIGIGETREERIDALLALRDLADEFGNIQEIIIQNFRAKAGTKMAQATEPPLEDLLWTIAMARIIFGPEMNIQAPPNLSPGVLPRLVDAGLNDWGGVSPVTPDFVNPEKPWPEIEQLARETAAAGKVLVERLALYPAFVQDAKTWVTPRFETAVMQRVDGDGLVRDSAWSPGADGAAPITRRFGTSVGKARGACDMAAIIERASSGDDLSQGDIVRLFQARGEDFAAVCDAADQLRAQISGEQVSYVVTRNINYTNVCGFKCQFCAFSKGKLSENLRGKPYELGLDEITRRVVEASERGAQEVCMQGGIHPAYTGDTYLEICRAVKQAVPDIHVHAFSPLEVWQGAATLGIPVRDFLARLRDAGLGSLPGTAAEILDDDVRAIICPDKLNTEQWLSVMAQAHSLGFHTTATIMHGHVDGPVNWARHLLALRNLQRQSLQNGAGYFTEFVPLPFVHMEAPIYLKGRARKGPTFREAVLMHAVARLALHPHITNIQTSWVKMGAEGAQICLDAGANDLGGTLMNETITRSAGATHGQEMPPERMEYLIRAIGRQPVQRTTLYGLKGAPDAAQVARSYGAPALDEVVSDPVVKRGPKPFEDARPPADNQQVRQPVAAPGE